MDVSTSFYEMKRDLFLDFRDMGIILESPFLPFKMSWITIQHRNIYGMTMAVNLP